MDLPIIAHVYPLTGISAKPFPCAGIGPSQTDGLVNRKRGLETRYQHLYLKKSMIVTDSVERGEDASRTLWVAES